MIRKHGYQKGSLVLPVLLLRYTIQTQHHGAQIQTASVTAAKSTYDANTSNTVAPTLEAKSNCRETRIDGVRFVCLCYSILICDRCISKDTGIPELI